MTKVALGLFLGIGLAGLVIPPLWERHMKNFEHRAWDAFARMTRKRARR